MRDGARSQAAAVERGLELSTDLDVVLANSAVDAVVIATPHSQHVDQCLRAARAGKQVFCEKPLSRSTTEAVEIVRACEAAGVTLAVGLNRRFLPGIAAMKDGLASGSIGQPLHVEGHYSAPTGFAFRQGNWRLADGEMPAGAMGATGIHLMDSMINMLGAISEVRAQSLRHVLEGADDTTLATFRFRCGATGQLASMIVTPLTHRLQIYGTEGWICLTDETRLEVRTKENDPRVTWYDSGGTVQMELEAFCDAVEGVAPYPLSSADAVHGTQVLEAIASSADRSGALVTITQL